MKKKWKYEVVNNQEDEDGCSLYPNNVIIFESAREKRNLNSNENTAKTESGSPNLAIISPGVRKRISQNDPAPLAKKLAAR